jgi:hypothetical protein
MEAGDIIANGTPGGVGLGRVPPAYLRDGDLVETGIEGIGMLLPPCCHGGQGLLARRVIESPFDRRGTEKPARWPGIVLSPADRSPRGVDFCLDRLHQ